MPKLLSVKIVSAQQPSIKTFAQWCQQRDSLPDNTKHTIDALLKSALFTKDCQEADRYLNKLNRLRIGYSQISDLRPLASLNKLTSLNLANNQISDLRPLANLNKLTYLNLGYNQIVDLRSVASLTELIYLNIAINLISDLRPIASLKNLTNLDLGGNKKISDIKPLASLTNLTQLFLDKKFTKKDCPVELEVCTWKTREQ